jgi:hypothetical protein
MEKGVKHFGYRLPVCRHSYIVSPYGGTDIVSVIEEAFVCSDSFSTAGSKHLFALFHVEQLVLQRGTAYVTNQYLHVSHR